MKNNILVLLFSFLALVSYSQEALLPITKVDEDGNVLDRNRELSIINNLNHINQKKLSQLKLADKGVFVSQIGDYNRVDAFVSAPKYNVDIYQKGDDNIIDVKLKAKELVDYQVSQIGDRNTVVDYKLSNQETIKSSINQSGDDLKIENYGSNSILDRLEINMTGQNRTIAINSFK